MDDTQVNYDKWDFTASVTDEKSKIYHTCNTKGADCEEDFDSCSLNLCATGQNCSDTDASQNEQNPNLPAYTCGACPTGFHDQAGKCEGMKATFGRKQF